MPGRIEFEGHEEDNAAEALGQLIQNQAASGIQIAGKTIERVVVSDDPVNKQGTISLRFSDGGRLDIHGRILLERAGYVPFAGAEALPTTSFPPAVAAEFPETIDGEAEEVDEDHKELGDGQ